MRVKQILILPCLAILTIAVPAITGAQTYLGNFTDYSSNGNVVTVRADTSALRFIFLKSNVVRVDFLPALSTEVSRSQVVLPDSQQQVAVTVIESDSSIRISTSDLTLELSKSPVRVSFYANGSLLLLREPAAGGVSYSRFERSGKFSILPGEHFYGTGERGISFDLRGQAFDSYNEQHGGYPAGGIPATMNVNIPFIVSSNHFGIYFDDSYKGHFDIGGTEADVFEYTAYGGELSYYFVYDPTYAGILSDYTWLTGRAPLLPQWAYGYIQSKFGYRNYQDAQQTIQRFRTDSIPCDAIVLDLYWFRNMGDLDWNTSAWPNPSQIAQQFLSEGFKTIVITEPYIIRGSLNFDAAVQNGYLATDSTGQSYILNQWWSCGCDAGLLDITNPAARDWWWSKYQNIFQTGVSGIWTDLGEPERDSPDMRFYAGSDSKIHNIYDFLWAKTLFDGFDRSFPDSRFFNLTRSGYAGIQRFGTVTWSGDVAKTFSGLAVQLPILMNMSMSGIAYHNSDIGGFTGSAPTTPELYTRWMEFGAFCPIMRAHGYDALGGTEPWAFNSVSPSTEDLAGNIIKLRYSLLPYNYTMAHEACQSGIPMARPLVMEYPDDPNVADESGAYMWGDDMLVAPVVEEGQTEKSFYMPGGKWVDFWNDSVYAGGQSVTVPAPIGEIPLFIKSGSIIPSQPVRQYIGGTAPDTLIASVYPDAGEPGSFSLYEDDGRSLAYQSGAYSLTLFHDEVGSQTASSSRNILVSIGRSEGSYDGKPSRRVYLLEVHLLASQPAGVSVNGTASPRAFSEDSLGSMPSGYWYNDRAHILDVKLTARTDSAYSIEIDSAALSSMRRTVQHPSGYGLNQNYPNPFNPSTVINYSVPEKSYVSLTVYDILGRTVATLVDRTEDPGTHKVVFDGSRLTSGVYFYRLTSGSYNSSREMMLLK